MPTLSGKLGQWVLPHVHMWKDRTQRVAASRVPIVKPGTRIATIGSCFAEELASAMGRVNLRGAMHPGGLFYTSRSIRQEMERVFGGWPQGLAEPTWKVPGGLVHPFKSYHRVFPTAGALESWSAELDGVADELFRGADVVVITLGLIEAWRSLSTGNFFREIPHPDVFSSIGASFHRLTVAEMKDDLARIRHLLRANTGAEIVLTVSPVPLHATLTPLDVRVANSESKGRIRAAVSEFVEENPDVHYFHSYEIVATAEVMSDFMLEDGRHVARPAVDYIINEFLKTFAVDELVPPEMDTRWLTAPLKTAARPTLKPTSLAERARAVARRVGLRV